MIGRRLFKPVRGKGTATKYSGYFCEVQKVSTEIITFFLKLPILGPIFTWIAGKFKSKSDKIDIAIRQGFEICRAHYPPAIMTTVRDDIHWICPECGNKRSTPSVVFGSIPRWRR